MAERVVEEVPVLSLQGIGTNYLPEVDVQVLEEGKAWVLRNVYTQAECDFLISEIDRLNPAPISNAGRYRVCDRVEIDTPAMVSDLYRRVSPYVPAQVVMAEGDDSVGPFLDGTWDKSHINSHLRMCRYQPGGFFCAHRDGHYMEDPHTRSFFTVMLYLNGGLDGGETNFLDLEKSHVPDGPALRMADPEAITHSVRPEPGLVLLFWHPMLHEGGQLHSGHKYMMRSEVMFRRQPESCSFTENDLEALKLLDKAVYAESEKQYEEAARLYRQAARKSKRLADHLRM